MKILIVDSSVQMIQRLEEILSEAAIDLTIYSAVSYEAAAKLFKENIPDIALLNISLHATESFTLLKEIKEAGCNTSVIVLSIHTDGHIQGQCKLLSADYFLDKYYDFEKIPAIINTIAGKNKIRETVTRSFFMSPTPLLPLNFTCVALLYGRKGSG